MRFTMLLFLAFAFASCTSKKSDQNHAVFRYNQSGGINSLDPAFARDLSNTWVTNQLFNGLLQLDNNLHVQPCLAKSYTIDSSATLYTFLLRDDVYFHKNACFGVDSTRKVVASDVVYSLNRLKDPAIAAPGKWVLNDVDSLWAENDSIVKITLNAPYAPFAGILTMKYCSIIPQEAISYYGSAFNENPVGTGPFRFIAWHRNEKLVLRKNEHYFEVDEKGNKLPYIDGIAISFITDQQAAFLEFLKGNIDFVNGLDQSYKDEVLTANGELKPRYAEKYTLAKQPYLNTEYLIFTVDTAQEGPQHDRRLRQAINLGFNRDNMMAYLRNNIGKPAHGGIIPLGMPGNINGHGFTYDPQKAAQLLNEIKATYGTLPELTLTTVANYRDLCEFIQSELGKLGLTINVDVVPPANLREQKAKGTLAFFRASWIADYPDAENYLSLFYGPNRSPNGPNYSRYYTANFDALYQKARAQTDDAKRVELYKRLDSLLVADCPIVPLFYDEVVRIYPKTISGLAGNSMNVLDLRFVKMKSRD